MPHESLGFNFRANMEVMIKRIRVKGDAKGCLGRGGNNNNSNAKTLARLYFMFIVPSSDARRGGGGLSISLLEKCKGRKNGQTDVRTDEQNG